MRQIITWLLSVHLVTAYGALTHRAPSLQDIQPKVLQLALKAMHCAKKKGLHFKPWLTIVDYSLPSSQKRLWVIDLTKYKPLFQLNAAHGKNSGGLYARSFSNQKNSFKSSLGLFKTGQCYHGHHGLSLRLHGLEKGINDRVLERRVVLHGSRYASDRFLAQHGRIGRSHGCIAIKQEATQPVIDTIKGGSLVFIYGSDRHWLTHSDYLNCR